MEEVEQKAIAKRKMLGNIKFIGKFACKLCVYSVPQLKRKLAVQLDVECGKHCIVCEMIFDAEIVSWLLWLHM